MHECVRMYALLCVSYFGSTGLGIGHEMNEMKCNLFALSVVLLPCEYYID